MEKRESPSVRSSVRAYAHFAKGIADLLDTARRASARTVNAIMTATYWEIGRRIVEFEQRGKRRAAYGERVMKQLASDLTQRFGRGFAKSSLFQMRSFYLEYSTIFQTAPGKSHKALPAQKFQTVSGKSLSATQQAYVSRVMVIDQLQTIARAFPLSWSHYVRLLSVKERQARSFYEAEALRGGWSVRQLDRQIASRFYERTLLSRNKAALLTKGAQTKTSMQTTPEEEIKDPYILEFLGLKDEYSETDLEDALVQHLQNFLLELGEDFAFVSRQKRLRIGTEWYKVDLVFFHRRLRCLVIIDLKVGKFTHADAGQMHMYLNYAREHWMRGDENPPVGLILCAEKDSAVAKYALEGLPNKVVAAHYKLTLPDERKLVAELERTQRLLELRKMNPT